MRKNLSHIFCAALFLGLFGCKKEGRQLGQAYQESIRYARMFDQKRGQPIERAKLPKEVFRAKESSDELNRHRLSVDVFVPFGAAGEQIRRKLKQTASQAMRFGRYKAVRVRAYYQGLVHFGGVLGTYVLSSDGGGWDGRVVGYRVFHMNPPAKVAKQDYKVAVEVEKTYWGLLNAKRRRKAPPGELEEEAIQQTAQKLALTPESVAATIARVRAAFGGRRTGSGQPRSGAAGGHGG